MAIRSSPRGALAADLSMGGDPEGEHEEHQAGDHINLVSDRGTSVDKPLYFPAGQASSAVWALVVGHKAELNTGVDTRKPE